MKVTAQNGEVVEVKSIGLFGRVIKCLFPNRNRCILGTYPTPDRAREVYKELSRKEMFSDDEFEMPQE